MPGPQPRPLLRRPRYAKSNFVLSWFQPLAAQTHYATQECHRYSINPSEYCSCSIHHHTADRLAFCNQLKCIVDLFERHGVGDHLVDRDFSVHVPVDDFRHVCASTRAAESRAFPDAASDELERSGRYFLTRGGNADYHRSTPTAMATFERLTHRVG